VAYRDIQKKPAISVSYEVFDAVARPRQRLSTGNGCPVLDLPEQLTAREGADVSVPLCTNSMHRVAEIAKKRSSIRKLESPFFDLDQFRFRASSSWREVRYTP
jgi:hypothetical protein